jgi:hypothetical protein
MKTIRMAAIVVALITAACGAGTSSPAASTNPSAVATASAAEPTASASAPATSQLIGRWATGQTTCAEQNAALEAAGFTAEQMTLGGWSSTCAEGMPHGSEFIIYFTTYRLVIFQDGEEGWDGQYRVVDDQTFEAGDGNNGYYITYHYAIDGDQLTIDMVKDDCPPAQCTTPAELAGEQIAQTVIYETSPFTRVD